MEAVEETNNLRVGDVPVPEKMRPLAGVGGMAGLVLNQWR
jgi:hypothetical protein